jgi:hypothetical protein
MKVISLSRSKYRLITLKPIFETDKKALFFTDHALSILKCIIFCLKNKKKKINIYFCDGDINTINFLILKFFLKINKLGIIWFNSIIEIKYFCNPEQFEHYIFFAEQVKYIDTKLKIKHLLCYPTIIKNLNNYYEYNITYISEVKKDINNEFYPHISFLDKKFIKFLDEKIWEIIKKNNLINLSNVDLIKKVFENIFIEKNRIFNNSILIEIYILIKNRIRFMGIKIIQNLFQDDLILIGKSWKENGFKTFDDNNKYDYNRNINLYKKTKIPLDFGANSGEYPLYPRTYEIIKNANWLMQSNTRYSKILFGKFYKKISFNNFDEMKIKIKTTLNQNDKFSFIERNNFTNDFMLRKKSFLKSSKLQNL